MPDATWNATDWAANDMSQLHVGEWPQAQARPEEPSPALAAGIPVDGSLFERAFVFGALEHETPDNHAPEPELDPDFERYAHLSDEPRPVASSDGLAMLAWLCGPQGPHGSWRF